MGMGALQNVKIMKMVKSRDVGTPCVELLLKPFLPCLFGYVLHELYAKF